MNSTEETYCLHVRSQHERGREQHSARPNVVSVRCFLTSCMSSALYRVRKSLERVFRLLLVSCFSFDRRA